MVDHEMTAEEKFLIPKKIYLPRELLHIRRQFSAGEDLEEILKEHDVVHSKEFYRSASLYDVKPSVAEKWDSQRIRAELSNISAELLNRSPADYEGTTAEQEVKRLENAYKNVTEKFLFIVGQFRRSLRQMRKELIKSLQTVRMFSRSSAQVILASSIVNVAMVMGSLVQRIFPFAWNSRISLLPTVMGALTFTTSLLTLSYMKRTTNEIAGEVKKEGRLLRELVTAHRKGDWVDAEVSRFFPFGVNVKSIDEKALEDENHFKTKYSWRVHLCSVIILSNIKKDSNLVHSEEFLTRVKLFVESPAAEIWWSRIKVKELLEKLNQKADNMSVKMFLSGHEDLILRTSVYVYPVLIPWLISSRNSEEMKFICICLAGILAAIDLGNDSSDEFDKLRKISMSFEKDIKEIYKICEILDSIDD